MYSGEQFSKVLSTLTAVNKATEGKKKSCFLLSFQVLSVCLLGGERRGYFFDSSQLVLILEAWRTVPDAGGSVLHFATSSGSKGGAFRAAGCTLHSEIIASQPGTSTQF